MKEDWNNFAKNNKKSHLHDDIARYKRDEHIRLIEDWIKEKKGVVLKTDLFEEAFGEDYFIDYLSKKFKSVIGNDVSDRVLRKSKIRFNNKNIRYLNNSVLRLKLDDESVDIVISNSTLDHVSGEDMKKALREFKRILKSDGQIILTLDNKHNPLYRMGYFLNKYVKKRYYQDKCYTIKEVEIICKEVGFDIKKTVIVHLPTPFNKVALIIEKIKLPYNKEIIRWFIKNCSKIGNTKLKYRTGWFLAFLLEKKET